MATEEPALGPGARMLEQVRQMRLQRIAEGPPSAPKAAPMITMPHFNDFTFWEKLYYTSAVAVPALIVASMRLRAWGALAWFHPKNPLLLKLRGGGVRQVYAGHAPFVGRHTFLAHNASVIGKVSIGAHSSVWYQAVLRGDVNSITIGSRVHLQDGVVVHVSKGGISGVPLPTFVGDSCVVGPNAVLHACTLKGRNIVGPGAQLLDGSVMESDSILAPGSVVTPGKVVPSGQLWAGSPARYVRTLSAAEIASIGDIVQQTAVLAEQHGVEAKKDAQECITEVDNHFESLATNYQEEAVPKKMQN